MAKYSKQDILDLIEEEDIEFIRLQFTDIAGNLKNMAATIDQIDKILNTVQGIEDLGVIRNIGQPELRIELNERQLARYGGYFRDLPMETTAWKSSTFYL